MNDASTAFRQTLAARDPIAFEVIRHKLQAIVEEQAITQRSVSGSPVVTDATDFNCGLYLPNGDIVVTGSQVLFHSGTMSTVIKAIIQQAQDADGLHEGDMFILNDPYRGAIHQPDVSIVAPIFHAGAHVGWAGSCAHQLDMGGMNFGSWAYKATEIQQEAILLTGLRIVEGGRVRQDLWRSILAMSRLPEIVGLDFKAMIAANTVAIRRVKELLQRYGAEQVQEVMERELDTSETAFRERLKALPDGRYAARDYLDHDGHTNRLYHVEVVVIKEGNKLTFDLSNSSEQAPGFINCTYSGLRGALFAALLPVLAPDIPWNEGLMRAVSIVAPEGLICNAKFPAPVSGATVSTAWVVTNAAVAALSRFVGLDPTLDQEGQAVTKGHMSVMTLSGINRDGTPYGNFLMDSMAGGGGAFIDHDGLDGSGDYVVPRPQISNVETAEASGPILYLFRSFMRDTAGAGRSRGGVGAALAITPYDTDRMEAMIIGHGVEVPNSAGIFGGRVGSCGQNRLLLSDANPTELVRSVTKWDVLADRALDLGAKPGHVALTAGDVLAYSFQGGGGYGDPLLRDPQAVAADFHAGFVSSHQAVELYGVILQDGTVDRQATEEVRNTIRRERLGRGPTRPAPTQARRLFQVSDQRELLCACGAKLAGPGENWKEHVICREVEPHSCGPYVKLHDQLHIAEYICPDCGTLLEQSIERHGMSTVATITLQE